MCAHAGTMHAALHTCSGATLRESETFQALGTIIPCPSPISLGSNSQEAAAMSWQGVNALGSTVQTIAKCLIVAPWQSQLFSVITVVISSCFHTVAPAHIVSW